MATSFDNCGICYLRHVSQLSVVWCSDCDEGLCQECSEHHSLSKSSRNHNVVPIAEYQTLPSFIANINMHCDEHDETYLLFCKEHNECVCRKCVISETHRECKEMFPVEDVMKDSKTSAAFTEIESSLQELRENITLILEDRQKNMSSISASKKKIESDISAIRQQINIHLDTLQDNFIAELTKTVENSTKEIQSFVVSVTKNQRDIDKWIEEVESIKKHATDMQTFLGMTQLEMKLNKTSNDLQSWIDGDHLAQTVVSYQLSTLLHNISNEITHFGKTVVEVIPSKLSLQRRKQGQAQMMKVKLESKSSIQNIKLELKYKINTTASHVSSCCILPNGNFVVSNFDPSFCILFAPDGKIEKKITNIMPNIIDVVSIDNETIAVISYTKKKIKLVSLKSGETLKTIDTTSAFLCLTYTEGNLIVCPETGRMQEVSLEDNKTNDIGRSVSRYITSLRNTFYSVQKHTNTIFCHKRNGDILWKFTNEEVLKKPRGITVDEHGNAIVAGVVSNNVIAISADGTQHKILLSQTDLCSSPWAVSFNTESKYLLVCNEKDGQAFLYSVNNV